MLQVMKGQNVVRGITTITSELDPMAPFLSESHSVFLGGRVARFVCRNITRIMIGYALDQIKI